MFIIVKMPTIVGILNIYNHDTYKYSLLEFESKKHISFSYFFDFKSI